MTLLKDLNGNFDERAGEKREKRRRIRRKETERDGMQFATICNIVANLLWGREKEKKRREKMHSVCNIVANQLCLRY
jgi:hypothetical protein